VTEKKKTNLWSGTKGRVSKPEGEEKRFQEYGNDKKEGSRKRTRKSKSIIRGNRKAEEPSQCQQEGPNYEIAKKRRR